MKYLVLDVLDDPTLKGRKGREGKGRVRKGLDEKEKEGMRKKRK